MKPTINSIEKLKWKVKKKEWKENANASKKNFANKNNQYLYVIKKDFKFSRL